MGLNFSKGALFSKGVWGGLLALVPAVDNLAVLLGLSPVPVLAPAVSAVASAAGVVLALYGRIKAKTKIVGIV